MKLVSIPANPVPDDAVVGTITSTNQQRLRFARFAGPPGRRGTVCIFSGRTEFIEKYFETVHDLRRRGFAVAILDWRGQGLSSRPLDDPCKAHIRSFSEYDDDLAAFMHHVVLPDCPPPYFALAHSMGGTVIVRAAAQGRRWFDRVVLSAPMIEIAGYRFVFAAKAAIRAMTLCGFGTSYIPGGDATVFSTQPFAGNPLTSDPVRYARNAAVIEAEPALSVGSPTVGWANAAFGAMDELADPAYANRIHQPMLIIAAGADAIVSTPAIDQFAVRLRAGSHVILPGARHELLMEQDWLREQFWAAFDAFVPGTASY